MWKTVFKKIEVMPSASADHITPNFVKAVFHKFYLVHSWIFCPIYTVISYYLFLGKIVNWGLAKWTNLHWRDLKTTYHYKTSFNFICWTNFIVNSNWGSFIINWRSFYYKLVSIYYKSGQLLHIGAKQKLPTPMPYFLFQVDHVNSTNFVRVDCYNFESSHGSASRVRSMCCLRDDTNLQTH